MKFSEKLATLLSDVSYIEGIRAIGQTGDTNIVPKAGETDIDIFILGDTIPSYEIRQSVYEKNSALLNECALNVCEGGVWGTGDVFDIDGVETMLMYFTIDETQQYINDILHGKYLDSIKGFYPVGRLATYRNINILYDENETMASIQEQLMIYPDELAEGMLAFHLKKVNDEEDFGRALLRRDVLFYHHVLETALDHYLQALYAVNRTYFPSRKRTKQYIDSFERKPEYCYERLLEVIRLGSVPEGIEASYREWCTLEDELKYICGVQ